MVSGPLVVALAFAVFAVIWAVVLLGSRHFGPQ
jgi:hypothetical protein